MEAMREQIQEQPVTELQLVEREQRGLIDLEPQTVQTTATTKVREFYDAMHDEFDKAIYGETAAKDAAITSIVMGLPVLLSGYPAGGKSTLSEMMPSTIQDVSAENVALISGQHDLTGNQIIGGEVKSNKELIAPDGTVTDRQVMRTVIKGIVKARTMFLRLEEMNGINPNALRSLLPVLENGRVENSTGELIMPDLISVIGTMNPTESSQSTFTISDAMASRFAIGAVMGVRGSRTERLEKQKGIRAVSKGLRDESGNFIRARDIVQPVIARNGLPILRTYVLATEVGELTEDKIDEMAIDMTDKLEEMGIITETDNRIGKQIEMNAKVLGGLRNSEHKVLEDDLHDAVRTVIVARAGALQNIDDIDLEGTVKEITKN